MLIKDIAFAAVLVLLTVGFAHGGYLSAGNVTFATWRRHTYRKDRRWCEAAGIEFEVVSSTVLDGDGALLATVLVRRGRQSGQAGYDGRHIDWTDGDALELLDEARRHKASHGRMRAETLA